MGGGHRPPARLSGVTPGERVRFRKTARDLGAATTAIRPRFTRPVGAPRRLSMPIRHSLARRLAEAFRGGPWDAKGLFERGARTCGQRPRWLRSLAKRAIEAFTAIPDAPILADWIEQDLGFRLARLHDVPFRRLFWPVPASTPPATLPLADPLPTCPTPAAFADWLGLSPPELDWFSDCHGRTAAAPPGPLRHYSHRWLPKSSGRPRLLEVPKARLKAIQR